MEPVRLVTWSSCHEPELVAACNDPSISDRLPVPVPYRESDARAFTQTFAPSFFAEGGCNFAVVSGDSLAGCVSVRVASVSERRGRVGYWVASSFRGRGVAPAAVELVCRWAKETGFSVLELTIGVDNPASQAVAAKAGFSFVELLPDFEVSTDLFKDTLRLERVL